MFKLKISMVIMLLLLFCISAFAGFAEAFTPKAGRLEVREFNGVKIHLYSSSSASVIFETKNSLILQDTQTKKANNDEVKALIDSLGKPLSRIYISHDHAHHWIALELFKGVPVYANQQTIDAIKNKGKEMLQEEKKKAKPGEIPYTEVIVPDKVVPMPSEETIDGIRFTFSAPAIQVTGPMLFTDLPDQKVLIHHHLAYVGMHLPMPPVDARIDALKKMKEKYQGYAWLIGGHGMSVPGSKYFDATINYFTKLGEIIKESPDAAAAKEKLVAAFPKLRAVAFLDRMLPRFYKK